MFPKDGTMHFSNLKHFAQSPLHYAFSCDSEYADSTSKKIGRAFHASVLQGIEPILFEGRRAGKEWEQFKENCEGKGEILIPSEFEPVQMMLNSIRKNAFAMELLNSCHTKEKTLKWMRDGVLCSGTPDAYSDDILIELKSCSCAKPRKFLYDAGKFFYHAQMPWYDIALGTQYILSATKWRKHYIIAVENTAPYSTVVFKLDDLRIDQGHTLCEDWLEQFKQCQKTGFFPSYQVEEPYIWDGEIIIEEEEED